MFRSSLLLALFGISAIINPAHAAVNSTMTLTKVPAGRCMDGTPAAYYFRASPSGAAGLWVMSLEGGGGCHDQVKCTQRSKTALGSSKSYKDAIQPNKGWMSADPALNPDFHDANLVYVPYCSSDTHT